MSLLDYLTYLALMSAFGAAMAARRYPTVGWPQAAWAALVLGTLGLALPWWPGRLAAVILVSGGIAVPVLLFACARAAASRGDFARALAWGRVLGRIRSSDQVRRWQALWAAAHAFHQGDPAPAEGVRRQLLQEGADGLADVLAVFTRRWDQARWSSALDVQARALCELGEVEAGIEVAARSQGRRLSWSGIQQARLLWLPCLAFAGRVEAVQRLVGLLGLAPALATLWHATALSAAGQPEAARRLLEALDDVPLPPAQRTAVHHRLAWPPRPVALGPAAAEALRVAELEIRAGLRLKGPRLEPVTLALLAAMVAGFAWQTTQGGSTSTGAPWSTYALVGGQTPPSPLHLFSYGFLHFGWLHLVVNSLGTAVLGPMVARLLGPIGLAVVFLGAVAGGGLAITAFGSPGTTVGASAGVMGLLGAVGMGLWRHPELRGTATGAAGGRFALVVIAVQVAFDLSMVQVSFAGHTGGLLAGALLALGWIEVGQRR